MRSSGPRGPRNVVPFRDDNDPSAASRPEQFGETVQDRSPANARGSFVLTPDATVFIIEDDHALRESLCSLVGSLGLPTEAYGTAPEFLAAYAGGRPGCVVCDVRLPGMSGLDLQQHLAARGQAPPMIMISGFGDVAMAVRAMRAGAIDFLEKPFSSQLLLDRVHEGIDHDRRVRALHSRQRAIAVRAERLTPREREVMALVVAGKANRAIAMDLGLREKTIEVHRAHVMRKMEAESLVELVRLNVLLRTE